VLDDDNNVIGALVSGDSFANLEHVLRAFRVAARSCTDNGTPSCGETEGHGPSSCDRNDHGEGQATVVGHEQKCEPATFTILHEGYEDPDGEEDL
jgi:hypothetical protein